MRDGALGCTFKRKTDVVGGADQKFSHFPDLARPHAEKASLSWILPMNARSISLVVLFEHEHETNLWLRTSA